MIFEKIRWKNFLSTGNQYSEINLQKSKTTLIIGSNGAGKSTVLDALTFSLFGKPFRKINKSQLINTTNEKDCRVEVEFLVNDINWKVIRGIKPNIFEIHRDNKCLDQFSSANDQQKWLEQNVVKMNYKSFTQIVILGSSTFVPFMQLSSSNRREVIEDLLDIKIFSSMNNIIKDKLKLVKDEVRTLDLKKESLVDKVDMQKNFISEIDCQNKANIDSKKSKIELLLKEENDLVSVTKSKNEEMNNLQNTLEKYVGATDKLRKLGTIKGTISNKVLTITKKHEFFKQNSVCPTCKQDIEEDFRLNNISDAQGKIDELQSGYQELEEAIKKEEEREHHFTILSKEITQLTHGISQNNTRISGCHRQVRDLEQEIQGLTHQIANRNTEKEKLKSFEKSLGDTYNSLASKKDTINYYDFSYDLLKDGGVKSKIIKKYLPLINKQVNRYLHMMDFYINFTLDEEFNETVQSPIHDNFSYSSFSEGEKMRIDLALLFTWREVARFKNSVNTNLLIMDEVFDSSLDGFGTEEFLKIIRFVIQDANVFVISHKTGMDDRFGNVLKFEKVKGFSGVAL